MILLFRADLYFPGFLRRLLPSSLFWGPDWFFAWVRVWGNGLEKEGATTLSPAFSDDSNEEVVSSWFTRK